jgi:hypothetical protein
MRKSEKVPLRNINLSKNLMVVIVKDSNADIWNKVIQVEEKVISNICM